MLQGLRGRPGRWQTLVVAMIAIVVIGCGSTNPASANPSSAPQTSAPASVTPSPTASPSPTPSPSPTIDLSKAFLTKINAIDFAGKSVVAGELDVAAARYAISGSFDVSGTDSHTTVLVATPGGLPDETIVTAGKRYHRTGTGPWFVLPPSTTSDLTGFMRSVSTVTDSGVETKAGKQLHHLTLPTGTVVPASALGLTDPSITGLTASIEFWSTDDGTVGVIGLKASYKQTVSGAVVDVVMTIEYTFSSVGTKFAIDAPTDVWTMYDSKFNHVTIAHPTDWDVIKSKKTGTFDEFDGPIYAFATIGRYAAKGVSLNALVKYFIAHKPSYLSKYHVDKSSSTTMNGISARKLLIHATYKGVKQYWVVYIALKGTYFYELDVFDKTGHEADTQALADQFVSSVVIK